MLVRVPTHQPGNGSVNPKLRLHLLPGPRCLHVPRKCGSVEGWGCASSSLDRVPLLFCQCPAMMAAEDLVMDLASQIGPGWAPTGMALSLGGH